MADKFFGFDTEFPSGITVLGKLGLDDELLTDEVEDEYDALNDETFGRANNDDWESAHEKLADLIKISRETQSVFNDSLLETDESQDEIVSKSISQLGLEDDLDDPAIMTISKNYSSSRLRSAFVPSPPPPAILETEICGSPKTHSIWSTTPKDSGIASFLNSIGRSSGSFSHQDTQTPLNSSNDNVFSSPPQPKAWRAEELEKDLLSSSIGHGKTTSKDWPQIPQLNAASHQNLSNKSPPPQFPNINNNLNKIDPANVLIRKEVERFMHSDQRISFPSKTANYVSAPFVNPLMRPNILVSNAKNLVGSPLQATPALRHPRGPMLGGNGPVPDRPFMTVPYGVNARMNMPYNKLPVNYPLPGFGSPNMNLNQAKIHSMPRTITHPLMHKQFQFPFIVQDKRFENEYRYENEYPQYSYQSTEDEYAELMTKKEKEWLLRIQLMLLKQGNPYVEDYYFTTQVARRCRKKYLESSLKGGGDAPELILPEMSKHENRTYVPTQFEGSLGKLQAVSVNFPRKVLDITVAKPPEEEGKVVPNQSLIRRHRRLLLDIEKLYNKFLSIEDEERKILALPNTEEAPHRQIINLLKKDLFTGFFCDNSSDENFQNIMSIRKGRSLVMRSLQVFNMEQQIHCLCALFRCLPLVLKKDQNDLVLMQHCSEVTDIISKFMLADLVKLAEALENDASSELSVGKDKSNFLSALKNKFGSTVICSMLIRAENLYCGYELFESDVQTRWAKVMLHLVDSLCSLTNSLLSPPLSPCKNLVVHFQRFDVNKDTFEVLKEKLCIFETNSNSNEKTNVNV